MRHKIQGLLLGSLLMGAPLVAFAGSGCPQSQPGFWVEATVQKSKIVYDYLYCGNDFAAGIAACPDLSNGNWKKASIGFGYQCTSGTCSYTLIGDGKTFPISDQCGLSRKSSKGG